MKTISETEHARLPERFPVNRAREWACLVSLPPAYGLGLFVTLPVRERIADCAELGLLHAAGNTSPDFIITQWELKRSLRNLNRRRREPDGSRSASLRLNPQTRLK